MAAVNTSTRAAAATSPGRSAAAESRAAASPIGSLPPALLEACRCASLQLGGPRLTSLGVTSTVRGEGRSSIVLALAHIQAQDYQRSVLLVDLDLERPGLAGRLGAAPSPGVAELAEGSASVDDVLQPLGGGITLLAAGAPGGAVTRVMAGILRSNVLQAVGERFDMVVADLPPLLGSSCGQAPVAAFGDLLLVVRSGVTPLGRIRQATAHLPVPPTVLLNGTRSHLPPWLCRLLGC
jgi:Mrp family chromosome partitioning ATPase